jgi:uncharacterized membrane protein YgcG
MIHRVILAAAAALALTASFGQPALAQDDERILSYHSDIQVHDDSSMTVTETITVRVRGVNIQRGIYRDFPTRYADKYGNAYVVGFELLEVLRDGNPEPHHIAPMSNGKRIYIGHEDVFLPWGEYTYTIKFRTYRQLGFFADHDELYWNAIGTGWDFPIDEASATVTLPADAGVDAFTLEAYTGIQGAQEQAYRAEVRTANQVYFETTQLLNPYQGMTIVVMFPKGVIEPPSREERMRFWMGSYRAESWGLAGLVILFGFYFIAWLLAGVDPRGKPVVLESEPPEGLSPAALRYVANMGADFTAFTAALTSMATKGYLRIEVDGGGTHTITRHKAKDDVLSLEEAALGKSLFSGRTSVLVDQDNHTILSGARDAMVQSLSAQFRYSHFNRNVPLLSLGIIISLVMLVAMGIAYEGEKVIYIVCASMGVFGAAYAFMGLISLLPGQGGIRSYMQSVPKAVSVFLLLMLAGFALIPLGVLYFFASPWLPVIVVGCAALNAVFVPLLPRYTRRGVQLLNRIKGYRLALMGEQTRLPGSEGPITAVLAFMPYAIALGVHRQWAQQLEEMFRTQERPPMPEWYRDPDDRYFRDDRHYRHERLVNDLASSFTSSIASASSPPSSSSGGGGGGSSGGGGGGGGGGGW